MERQPCWEALDFESDVLGLPSARILLDAPASELALPALMADLRQNGLQFVSCRIPDDQTARARALENSGFRRIETQLSYRRAFVPVPDAAGQERVMLAADASDSTGSYETSCVDIARKAFVYDRFHSDPLIGREKADALKARWALNSFRGRADACLVIPGDTVTAAGFILCMRVGKDVVIDLIAVAPDHHGEGLGKALVAGALAHYRGQADAMRVGTQDTNLRSIALYESMGFILWEKMVTYHWHETGAAS
ncbi:MAG: GNAT family N-acetyltransferase [Rhodospirillales bacterium]|nr:GNAT family N-acetyltransferase [Rhodospirillales bacterium]